jgi:hypothetical protein
MPKTTPSNHLPPILHHTDFIEQTIVPHERQAPGIMHVPRASLMEEFSTTQKLTGSGENAGQDMS